MSILNLEQPKLDFGPIMFLIFPKPAWFQMMGRSEGPYWLRTAVSLISAAGSLSLSHTLSRRLKIVFFAEPLVLAVDELCVAAEKIWTATIEK